MSIHKVLNLLLNKIIKDENKKEIETLEIQKNNSTLRAIKREPFILKLVIDILNIIINIYF